MTIADRIEQYAKAAAKSGLPVREVVVEKGKVRIVFGEAPPDPTNPADLVSMNE